MLLANTIDKVTKSLASASRIACLLSGVLVVLPAQQSGEKLVRLKDVEHITDAVLISNVSVAGKTVECGLFVRPPAVIQPVTPFQASSDWLEQMTISLINRTNKTIVYGGLIFHFLDVGDCSLAQPCVEAEIHLGRVPAIDAYNGRTGKALRPERSGTRLLDWKPRQTLLIRVRDYMPEMEQNLTNFVPVSDVTKVLLSRGVFYFDDGLSWRLGRYAAPDPEHPGKFKELPVDYFPGSRGNNWPPGYDNR